jgi:DNA repair exonuclease SbcCD ATPase subunit
MNVIEVKLQNFTKHADTHLKFPAKGVVLVSGPNGGGKSSIVEGVSWAPWGETLRGTRPTEEGLASVITDKGTITRERRGGKALVDWKGEARADTATKAQEGLDAALGTFEVWRRTHVFSSTDAAHFTLATDKERKLFLESMLGLGRFDSALEACRLELNATEKRLEKLRWEAGDVQRRLDGLETRRQESEASIASLQQADAKAPPLEVLEGLQSSVKVVSGTIAEARQDERRLAAEKGSKFTEARAVEHQLARLAKPGSVCGECRRPLPVDLEQRQQLEQAAKKMRDTAELEARKIDEQLMELQEQIADDEATIGKLRDKLSQAQRAAASESQLTRARALASQTLERIAADLMKERAAAALMLEELPKLAREEEVLAGAEMALGLKGARAGILGRLLSGLEGAANAWLSKIAAPGMKLELKPYSEKRSGGVSDAISLQVHGAGGGLGYKASSGGERRRVDVALLLAFAGTGTLFFDEVFDALDSDGIEAVVRVLSELAVDRCVVVITHSDELKARVPHVAAWHVVDGKVTGA